MAVLKFANHLCESSRISELFLFQKITSVAWDAGDMQLSHGIYMVVTLYIFRKWTVTSNFDGKVILLCVSKVRKLLGVNQIDAKLILHWAEYTKNHIFLFGSEHISLVTSYWSTKSRFQIILCMEYFCCSSLGLCHIQITNQQEDGDKDCSFTQSALSHHSVIKCVEYTSASSRIFTCISKWIVCCQWGFTSTTWWLRILNLSSWWPIVGNDSFGNLQVQNMVSGLLLNLFCQQFLSFSFKLLQVNTLALWK